MRQTFENQVAVARQAHRRTKLATYNRTYRARLADRRVPEPRAVQAAAWALIAEADDAPLTKFVDRLSRRLIEDGYDAVAVRTVVDRMLDFVNVETSV